MSSLFETFEALDGDTKFVVAVAVWCGFMAIVSLTALLIAKIFNPVQEFEPGERRRVRGTDLQFQIIGPNYDSYTPVRFDDGVVNNVKTSWIEAHSTRLEVM